jgi:hypothetical protein
MSEHDIVQTVFDKFAKSAGFSKKSGTWYLRSPETIFVLNLQKSQYGPEYYVNVALWLRVLGEEEAHKENKCQIRTRLTQLVQPYVEARLTDLLDLQSDIDDTSRRAELIGLLNEYVVPLIGAASSLENLRSGPGQELIRKSLVTGSGLGVLAGTL